MIRELDETTLAGYGLVLPPSTNAYRWFQISADHPYAEDWDLVAFRYLQRDPLLLEMRLLHIDELFLLSDDEDQPPANRPEISSEADLFREGLGYILLNRVLLDAFAQLLARLANCSPTGQHERVGRFRALSADELSHMGLAPSRLRLGGVYYQYMPPKDIQADDRVTLVQLSRFSASSRAEQQGLLQVVTFDRRSVEARNLDPFDLQGHGSIIFDRAGAEDFIALLRASSTS